MEYKICCIADQKVFEENGKIYLTGYPNTKGVIDSHGHKPMNFNGKPIYNFDRFATNPVIITDHVSSVGSIAGNGVEFREDEKGFWLKILLMSLEDAKTDIVRHAISAYTKGFGRALSIGGMWYFEDKENPSHLTRADIYEVSLVAIGSDQFALLDTNYPKALQTYMETKQVFLETEKIQNVVPVSDLPVKFAEREQNWDWNFAKSLWSEFSKAVEKPNECYKNNFLWHDAKNTDSFESYQLPIGTVTDGKHLIIPRAVFAARAAIAGAKRGIDIPAADIAGVKSNINQLYDLMGLEKPFDNEKGSWSVIEIKSLGKADLDFIIRNEKLSRKAADYIASLICDDNPVNEPHAEKQAGEKTLKDETIINGLREIFNHK